MRASWAIVPLALVACTGSGTKDTWTPLPDDSSAEPTWHHDVDGDGYGDPMDVQQCNEPPDGFVTDGTDCDDRDPAVHPGAPEVCNERDDDCDRSVDEGLPVEPWYPDADEDGWGWDDGLVEACLAPEGSVALPGDCDDTNADVRPGAVEVCGNGLDDDCAQDGDARCRLEGEIVLADAPVKYTGGTTGDLAGYQLDCGGDTDGDGRPELLIGESEQFKDDYGAGPQIGGAWLVLEPTSGVHPLDATAIPIWGDPEATFFDGAKVFLQDQDGDGYQDVLMGSHPMQEAYLFRGPISAPLDRSTADATLSQNPGGLSLGWSAAALSGTAFAVAGPGNLYQDGHWGEHVGGAFVFEGPLSGPVTTDEAVASLAPHVSHEFGGFGSTMCSGDLDGDSVRDLVVGAPAVYNETTPEFMGRGAAYVVYGPFSGDLRMADADGVLTDADARIEGGDDVYNVGYALSCDGDVDADGLGDILVGAPDWSGIWSDGAGDAFLFLGPPSGVVEYTSATGRVEGAIEGAHLGTSVALDADLDRDGLGDAAVGYYGDAWRGEVSVFYGGFAGTVAPSAADASILGEAEGDYAAEVAGCPDLDGDGFDDLLIGAPGNSTGATWTGAAYVLFGGGG